MNEIKCPNCQKVFQVDESGYAQIIQQVRNNEFQNELSRREKELKERQSQDIEMMRLKEQTSFEKELQEIKEQIAERDRIISELNAKLQSTETDKKLAVNEALQSKEQELAKKAAEIADLNGKLTNKDLELELKEKSLNEKYETELKAKDEQIAFYKDFKARQSTKMIGESLEQHCLAEFNRIRMTAFPNAEFEKDNDASSGSKGDFIFRESAGGTEFISIMFEMKNEMDTTKTKHKNEDFFKELDKDRNEKNCEYAVLVSLLESDNELYNNGIVDVSYRYPKMFVVRPQFFIPIISLLRNAAMGSLEYKQKLAYVQSQELELNNFEENLAFFKSSFADSFRKASERYDDAIKGIDNAIAALTRIKENLVKSEKHLNAANNKIEDVNIKKLTHNAPSIREKFEELKSEGKS